jgi:hypothetical protein
MGRICFLVVVHGYNYPVERERFISYLRAEFTRILIFNIYYVRFMNGGGGTSGDGMVFTGGERIHERTQIDQRI